MRIACLLALVCCLSAADKPLTMDALHGAWVVDAKAVTKEQKAAAEAAAKVDGFGLTLTLRTARAVWSEEDFVAGMWRLEDATPTTATVIIQPKGGEERRLHLTLEKGVMTVAESPGKLPLKNSR